MSLNQSKHVLRARALRVARSGLSVQASRPIPQQSRQILQTSPTVRPPATPSRQHVRHLSAATPRHYPAQATDKDATKKACTKCGKPLALAELSCPDCGALQALPTSLDAYDLLGIDFASVGANGWTVDPGELKLQWRKRVALSHPDRMGGKDEKEQRIAAQQSALINKAYETLREPLQRAHLLLEKHSSTIPSESESLEDPAVLMEVMELREGLEESETEDAAAEIRSRNKVNLDESIKTLEEAFASTPIDVEKARTAAVGLRYWTNIDKAAREWQPGSLARG